MRRRLFGLMSQYRATCGVDSNDALYRREAALADRSRKSSPPQFPPCSTYLGTPSLSARRRALARVSSLAGGVVNPLDNVTSCPFGFLGRSPAWKNTFFPFLCPRSLPCLYRP